MPEAAHTEGEGETAGPEQIALELEPGDLKRLADLVHRLLIEDVALMRERRGETAARWR